MRHGNRHVGNADMNLHTGLLFSVCIWVICLCRACNGSRYGSTYGSRGGSRYGLHWGVPARYQSRVPLQRKQKVGGYKQGRARQWGGQGGGWWVEEGRPGGPTPSGWLDIQKLVGHKQWRVRQWGVVRVRQAGQPRRKGGWIQTSAWTRASGVPPKVVGGRRRTCAGRVNGGAWI